MKTTRQTPSLLLLSVTIIVCVGDASADDRTGTFIDRRSPADLRLVSYNVNWDSIFPAGDRRNDHRRDHSSAQAFRRIVAALAPDIMCVQEINQKRPAQQVADIFDDVLPLADGAHWHATIGNDCVIVSRYPLSLAADQTVPPGQRKQAMALVDLPDRLSDRDLYIMNEHYKCCSQRGSERKRQQQSDAVANWMHDARTAGGSIDLPHGTPMIVLGDLNLVEGPGPLKTLLTGDIRDEKRYGSDAPPDWDGSDLTDCHPLHNGIGPNDYTWRQDKGRYKPARLDFVIYTDSVLTVAHEFVLNTTTMPQTALDAVGLRKFDVVLEPPGGFDHLPVVVDFRFTLASKPDGDVNLDGRLDFDDIAVFVDLYIAGASADVTRIAHGDYDADGIIDDDDLPIFLDNLLISR